MKNLAKLLVAVILATFMTMAFVGCGGDSAENDANTILIQRWGTSDEQKLYEALSDDFTEETGINVKWTWGEYSNYFTNIQTTFASNKNDIIFMNGSNFNTSYTAGDGASVFLNLNEVTELESAINGLMEKNAFLADNGQRIAMPVGLVSKRVVVNNADFTTAGVDLPTASTSSYTLSELNDILQPVITEVQPQNGTKYGVTFDPTELAYIMTASAGSPIVEYNSDGTLSVGVDTAEGKAALKEMRNIFMNNTSGDYESFHPSLNIANVSKDNALETGQSISGFYGAHNFPTLDKYGMEYTTIPTVKAVDGEDVMLAEFNSVMINKNGGATESAIKFVEWLLKEETQIKLAGFADLPVLTTAFNKITSGDETGFDASKYSAFAVGSDNIYIKPATSSTFNAAISLAMTELLETEGDDDTIVNSVVNQLVEAGKNGIR